jgi:glycerol-3-phosphate O-acyltransferase / dihydroxyacetone phosphate acyltransferase
MREARREAGRRISFLTAESSMRRRFVGATARAISASTSPISYDTNCLVPVMRAQDLTKPHIGMVSLHDRSQPLQITGLGTKFTELKPGMSIVLPHDAGSAEIASIESDTALTLKREFRGLKALELLEVPGGTPFKVAPKVDQSWVYEKVFERIEEGGCIGIYPEGGSHDRPDLLPLKGTLVLMSCL